MKVSDIRELLKEASLTPEALGLKMGISGMSIRRWLGQPGAKKLEELYSRAAVEAIFVMIEDGTLNGQSESAKLAIEMSNGIPQRAALRIFSDEPRERDAKNFEDGILNMLSRAGQSQERADLVHKSKGRLDSLTKLGSAWSENIARLRGVISSKSIRSVEKTVAIGALFYLLQTFDLIPDLLPVVGYLDDFAVLALACAFYTPRNPMK